MNSSDFNVPDSSPLATPKRKTRDDCDCSQTGNHPSTTPMGPPPSSAASSTPGEAPSTPCFNFPNQDFPPPINYGISSNTSSRGSIDRNEPSNSPLGRSIRGRERQPSGLRRQLSAEDDESVDEEDENIEGEDELPTHRGCVFRTMAPASKRLKDEDAIPDVDKKIEAYIDQDLFAEEELSEDGSGEADLFLHLRHDDPPYGQPVIGDESDLIMMNTPAATARVSKEAESIFGRSTRPGMSARDHQFQFGTIAKDISTQGEPARISEPPDLILKTEDLVCRLYDEGVGTQEDPDKLDNSLADITYRLIRLWTDYVDQLPQPQGDDLVSIGPGEDAEPFEKATYVAHLILRMHHTRFDTQTDEEKAPPLPEILFDWMQTSHNLYPGHVREISRYKPSPACHELYWQTLRNALMRGDANGAKLLLKNAGWEHVRKGPLGDKAYTGKALEHVRRFVDATCEMLEQCPAMHNNWDILSSSWTLFRAQARGSLDRLTLFAEGRDSSLLDAMVVGAESMSTLARKASSQIPWDIYENLQTVYGIVLGNSEAVLETAQDWCEATIGLFGWWDEGNQRQANFGMSQFGASVGSSAGSDNYLDRLVTVFHQVIRSGLSPNAMNPVEVAVASTFEGNVNAVIGVLRTWSLLLACSVAEIASLGKWLPPPDSVRPLPSECLDMEDLDLLGVLQPTSDDVEGIKDTTLVLWARELAGVEQLSAQRDGWEMAIQVLGRMDVPEKSEQTVGELLRDLLATLDEKSSATVDKVWRILSNLGMMNYAEETAETYADILSKGSHRYGEALWYFALAHRTDRVREVLNLLISYSLVQSTVYPAEKDLDEGLKSLLRRRTETLEERANQDLEAAQLLGRMLSGYAILRKFYEIRDELAKLAETSPSRAFAMKKQAAFALAAVISSSGDNIRGGLYDETRDAVVSEDFLLALLGEATVFINQSPPIVSLEQIDLLLKAIEDIQTVGSRVYTTCEEFFDLVLASRQGLQGSTPADLMKKSTQSLSGSTYMMSGSSMLASHMQKSATAGVKVDRGWDWRNGWLANTKGEDVLRKLRLGLAKDLAALWLEDADGVGMCK